MPTSAFLKLILCIWRRGWKCETFTTTPTTDNGLLIRKARSSIRLRWAKEKKKRIILEHLHYCTTFSGGENDESHIATPGTLFYQISLFWGHITTVFPSLFKSKNIYRMHFCWKTPTLLNIYIHVYCSIKLKIHLFIITFIIYIFVNYIMTFQLRRNTKWFFFYIQWKSEGLIMTCYHTCSKICTCTWTSSAVKMKLSILN